MHTKIQHASTIPPDRIPLLAPLCKRTAPIRITSCPLCPWPEGEDGEFDKEMLLDHIAKEIHAFSLRALPWADDNGQETDERIEYSTNNVRDWLVENNLSVNPSQERPVHERRRCLSEYFEQNAYFGGSSAASNSSDVDTVLSWEVELDNLKEVDGPLPFGNGHEEWPMIDWGKAKSLGVEGSDDDELGSDVSAVAAPFEPGEHDFDPFAIPEGLLGNASYIKGPDDDEPKSDVDSVGPVNWGGDIPHGRGSHDDGVQSEVDLEKPGCEALSDKRSGTPNLGPDQQHPAYVSPGAQSLSGALITLANNVENVAAGFPMFRKPLPEHGTEITSLIADLYSISHSLRLYSTMAEKGIYQQSIASVESYLELVRTSLQQTLDYIVLFLGEIELHQGSDRDRYKRTWTLMCGFFYDPKGSLANRLAIYKAFLGQLVDISKEYASILIQRYAANKVLQWQRVFRCNPGGQIAEIYRSSTRQPDFPPCTGNGFCIPYSFQLICPCLF